MLINHADIPAEAMAELRTVCRAIGPQVMGENYPVTPGDDLTMEQCAEVMEAITRKFWNDQVAAHKANAAAEAARQQALAGSADLFS